MAFKICVYKLKECLKTKIINYKTKSYNLYKIQNTHKNKTNLVGAELSLKTYFLFI